MMFREMRRSKQLLPVEVTEEILRRGTSGVLALAGHDGYPYAVPLSYVFEPGKLYFHSARSGHKLELIRENEKASFCVIDQDAVVPAELTTYFRSVIVFGRAQVVEDEQEKRHAMELLAGKYSPGYEQESQKAIQAQWGATCTVRFDIEAMTGKEAIELVRARQA